MKTSGINVLTAALKHPRGNTVSRLTTINALRHRYVEHHMERIIRRVRHAVEPITVALTVTSETQRVRTVPDLDILQEPIGPPAARDADQPVRRARQWQAGGLTSDVIKHPKQ